MSLSNWISLADAQSLDRRDYPYNTLAEYPEFF